MAGAVGPVELLRTLRDQATVERADAGLFDIHLQNLHLTLVGAARQEQLSRGRAQSMLNVARSELDTDLIGHRAFGDAAVHAGLPERDQEIENGALAELVEPGDLD